MRKLLAITVLIAAAGAGCAHNAKPVAKSGEPDCCTTPAQANASFDAIKALQGNWVSTDPAPEGQKPFTTTFRATSGGSAMLETLAAGTPHEMVNLYTVDSGNLVMTHYCHTGNQPHMKLASVKDGVYSFAYVSAGNLASRNAPHMDSLTMTVAGDKLTQTWSFYQDGKVTQTMNFNFKKQS